MATFIPIRFAQDGERNTIYKTLQPLQYEAALTWSVGVPLVAMIDKEDGGLPPDGRDFNGVFNIMTDHLVERQNGIDVKFSQRVVDDYSGYTLGAIILADDNSKHFQSLTNNNITDPNQGLGTTWKIYAGLGSVPLATSTVAGVMKVLNTLDSTDVGSALSAAQGKELNEKKINYTDTVNNLSSSETQKPLSALQGKVLNDTKVNRSGDTITGSLTVQESLRAGSFVDLGYNINENINRSIIFYNNTTERARVQATTAGRLEFINATSYGFDQTVDANISGNSASATRLQTARKINTVDFDGTGDITLPINNTLTSTSTEIPLAAAQGKALNDKMFGVGQTWQNVISSRITGEAYTNSTQRTIFVSITLQFSTPSSAVEFKIGGNVVVLIRDGADEYTNIMLPIPPATTYELTGGVVSNWWEFR